MSKLNPVVKDLIEKNCVSFERCLIIALIHSYRFYREHCSILCPFDTNRGTWRKDFRTQRYNLLYQAIDRFWKLQGNDVPEGDFYAPKELLSDILIDEANGGGADPKITQELLDELENDFYRDNITDVIFQIVRGPGFDHWLNIQLGQQFINRLHTDSQLGFMRADEIKNVLAAMSRGLLSIGSSNLETGGEVMSGSVTLCARVPCSLTGLSDVLGGGFGFGESTLIAGINAGGKTVLATQLAWDFANRGLNTVIFTTEQKPYQMIQRIVSNAATIKMSEFTNRRDLVEGDLSARRVLNIPEWMWNDPLHADQIRRVHQVLASKVYCVNWAEGQGYSITSHFDPEIERLVALGWNPQVIIFDWIGGGLEAGLSNRDHLRHRYQEAADYLINHGKTHNRIMIALAQLDKAKASNKSRTTIAMLSECKTMSNNMTNFIGISSLTEKDTGDGTNGNLALKQFLNVEKSRNGTGENIAVEQQFQFQRFRDFRAGGLRGGS